MYSDIVPPKKNSLINKREQDHEVHTLRRSEIYHTVGGKDRKSRWPLILFLATLIVLAIVYYSVFNNKTTISFESKTVIMEVKDTISMSLSEKNQNSSTTLSYNLIYNNENVDRNIFAPSPVDVSTSSTAVAVFSTITSTTTNSTKTVKFTNETATNVSVVKNTRIDVDGITYYLDKAVDIKPTIKSEIATTTRTYRIIGFKGSDKYEKFYATDYVGTTVAESSPTSTSSGKNSPGEDLLSLIPENFIPLKKGYVYDKNINQTALVVIDKKDFEKVLNANSKIIQDYVQTFKPIADLMEYDISINDYELVLDSATGLPVSFKNLNLEIKPRVLKDRVAAAFQGFSKDTMKKLKNDLAKGISMDVRYSPFWMSKVSDEDHISVEVK